METNNNQPAYQCRSGDVRATVWRRHAPKGCFHVVTFVRRYRQDGEWKETHGFSFREMLDLSAVLKESRAWMRAQGDAE